MPRFWYSLAFLSESTGLRFIVLVVFHRFTLRAHGLCITERSVCIERIIILTLLQWNSQQVSVFMVSVSAFA